MRKLIFSVLVFAFITQVSYSAEPIVIEGVENLGMGGVGSTFSGKYDVLYNPALLSLKKGFHLRLFDLPFSISKDVIDFMEYYSDNSDDLTDFDNLPVTRQTELLQDIADTVSDYRVRFQFSVANPNLSMGPIPLFGLGDVSIGAGLYNKVDVGVKMNSGILVPTVDFWGHGDAILMVPVSYAVPTVPFSLPGKLYTGVNVKFIYRSKFEEKRMSILEFDSLDIDDYDLEPGTGLGWDLGMLYDYSDKWNFSLVLKDLFSTRISFDDDTSDVIKGQLDFGASYRMSKMLLLAADFRDFEFGEIGASSMFTKLYLGGELNLLRLVRVRAGFYQGYPSFGLGLLGFLNYAYYGEELSDYPGLDPQWHHVISISLGF